MEHHAREVARRFIVPILSRGSGKRVGGIMQHQLHSLVTQCAQRDASHPAVIDGDRVCTYGELEDASNRLAHTLLYLGVKQGDRVALYSEKRIEAVVALYAIMKSGAVYVPLDAASPISRAVTILNDAGARHMVTTTTLAPAWSSLHRSGAHIESVVVCDAVDVEVENPAEWSVTTAHDVAAFPNSSVDSGAAAGIACILYTSGSTGTPKGVTISHSNSLFFVDWAIKTFDLTSSDVLASHAPFHFDLSTFDLFAAAAVGAAIALCPREANLFPNELRRFLEEKRVTTCYVVPSALSLLVTRGNVELGSFPELRRILFAGEVFPVKYLRQLMLLLPHVSFYNLYGPTETNVCTSYAVPRTDGSVEDPTPIGLPVPGLDVVVVAEDGSVARQGEVGELCVGGPSVTQGYWNNSAATERAFARQPISPRRSRLYRTGDLVRDRGDGNLIFLGRRDSQIKSRGYRIELSEIETCLLAHPEVADVVAVPVPDSVVGNRLEVVVVLLHDVADTALRIHCSERLPRYMIPEQFHRQSSLPRTSTGKIDRSAVRTSLAPG